MRYRFLRFPEGKEKALTLSYDDGCKYDEKLISILNQYGIKTTLNINSEMLGKTTDDWRLPAQKILELANSGGHEIALHGAIILRLEMHQRWTVFEIFLYAGKVWKKSLT